MGWRKALRGFGVVGLAVAVAGWFPTTAGATLVAFTVTDKRIVSSTGMARDVAAKVYWMVDDSKGTGVVYGVANGGKIAGTLNYRADPKDVEAVALHDNRLYVADIGDRGAKRDHVTVYYFTNPRASGLTVSYRAWDFRYPDGAHDAQTLLVTPKGRLYIATKGATGHLYRAPVKPSRDGINDLTKVGGDLPGMVTDGVIMPDGKRIALLTATKVVMVDAMNGTEVASADLSGPEHPKSLTIGLGGHSLVVGSEGKVYTMPIPGVAGASPSPSATPSDSGADDDPDDSSTGTSPSERGTLLALGVAGLVAIVAGVVVGVVRRRPEGE